MTVCSIVLVYKEPWLSIELADSILVFRAHATKTLSKVVDMTMIQEINMIVVGPKLGGSGREFTSDHFRA